MEIGTSLHAQPQSANAEARTLALSRLPDAQHNSTSKCTSSFLSSPLLPEGAVAHATDVELLRMQRYSPGLAYPVVRQLNGPQRGVRRRYGRGRHPRGHVTMLSGSRNLQASEDSTTSPCAVVRSELHRERDVVTGTHVHKKNPHHVDESWRLWALDRLSQLTLTHTPPTATVHTALLGV